MTQAFSSSYMRFVGIGGIEPKNPYIFLDEKRKAIAQMRKIISRLGIDPNDLGIFSRPDYKIAYEKRVSDNQ